MTNPNALSMRPIPLSNVGVIGTASSQVNGDWTPSKAFNGDYNNYGWMSNGVPAWLKAQLPTAKIITNYGIVTPDQNSSASATAWTFEGSNNDIDWTVLDTRSGINSGKLTRKNYSFINTTAYLYYKWNITAGNSGVVGVVEFEMSELNATLISNLLAWFKADAITGVSDGSALTSWTDSSLNGNNLDTVIGTAPKYRATNGPLGLPYVDHSIASGGLNKTSGVSGMPSMEYTFFAVMNVQSLGTQSLLNALAAGTGEIRLNNLKLEFMRSGESLIKTSIIDITADVWTIIIATFNGSGNISHFDFDGIIEDYAGSGNTELAVYGGLTYGNYQSSNDFFKGKTAEIGLYPSVLSTTDLTSLKSYLNEKYVTGPIPLTGSPALVYGYENVGVALTSSPNATVYGYEEIVLPSGFTGWGIPI